MTSTKQMRAQLRRDNREWPNRLAPVPMKMWPRDHLSEATTANRIDVLRSRDFLCQIVREPDGSVRMTINRTDQDKDGNWRDGITWDELMELKRQAGYGEALAIEFYPPDKDIVCVSNMRHLFVIQNGQLPKHWIK